MICSSTLFFPTAFLRHSSVILSSFIRSAIRSLVLPYTQMRYTYDTDCRPFSSPRPSRHPWYAPNTYSATLHFFMGGLNGGYLIGIPPRPPQARPRNSNVNSVLDAAVPLSLDLLYFSSTSWSRSYGADVAVTSGRDSSRLLTK